MNLEARQIIKKINTYAKDSEEFFGIYQSVVDRYWTFDDPDDDQQARRTLQLVADRGEPEMVMLHGAVIKAVFSITAGGSKAGTAQVGIGGKEYFINIATDKDELANLVKLISNAAIVKAREETGGAE